MASQFREPHFRVIDHTTYRDTFEARVGLDRERVTDASLMSVVQYP